MRRSLLRVTPPPRCSSASYTGTVSAPTELTTAARDEHGRAILTVGQLRALLVDLPDEAHVVVATDDWYVNVDAIGLPTPDCDPWTALTLFPGTAYDTRQA